MRTAELTGSLTALYSELANGAPDGGFAFMLNSGDVGLHRSLGRLSAAQASASVHGGATIAAHARHLAYGLSLMNQWAQKGGNPFADAKWDEAWKTSVVDAAEWDGIRQDLVSQSDAWLTVLGVDREVPANGLTGMISSIAHLAYHLGAIRQIDKGARGPTEGTFV
ncbi:MAG: hypothetical protein ABJE47_07610 [bacterium]